MLDERISVIIPSLDEIEETFKHNVAISPVELFKIQKDAEAQKLKKLKKIDAYIKSNWSNSLKQELASIELKCVPKRQGATIPCPDCASLKQFLLNQEKSQIKLKLSDVRMKHLLATILQFNTTQSGLFGFYLRHHNEKEMLDKYLALFKFSGSLPQGEYIPPKLYFTQQLQMSKSNSMSNNTQNVNNLHYSNHIKNDTSDFELLDIELQNIDIPQLLPINRASPFPTNTNTNTNNKNNNSKRSEKIEDEDDSISSIDSPLDSPLKLKTTNSHNNTKNNKLHDKTSSNSAAKDIIPTQPHIKSKNKKTNKNCDKNSDFISNLASASPILIDDSPQKRKKVKINKNDNKNNSNSLKRSLEVEMTHIHTENPQSIKRTKFDLTSHFKKIEEPKVAKSIDQNVAKPNVKKSNLRSTSSSSPIDFETHNHYMHSIQSDNNKSSRTRSNTNKSNIKSNSKPISITIDDDDSD